MNLARLVLAILFFGCMVCGAIAGLKIIIEGWARKTSSAMFCAMVLIGLSIESFFRLWAMSYAFKSPLPSEVAWRSITGMIIKSVPVILFALYTLRIIKGGWLKGQNGSIGQVPEIRREL